MISNYAGLVFAVSGALATAGTVGITLPEWLVTASILAATISGAVIGWLTGKKTRP